ncbi:PIN domain-containing protein [Azospirillum sp. RWY-5-1]|uniref:PIN domain-containing protein n=1 Tax=Azospirillum oleiclasticum TaxID=2735135 RepID=A0ABX2TAL7_9PROT|nr:PIN domain-containing protein [Azospirillum oleiclasticum]NYZ15281.1 PIN domain-containing protein [Azospirillum oleiclasticum]NYZ21298.1 PIN domain-containing protein [Azospirillum oleiclasticum]
MIAVDTNVLLYLIKPDTVPPQDAPTGKPVERCQERVEFLISTLSKTRTKLVLPTPAITEMLVSTGESATAVLEVLRTMSVFRIADFDQRAALECSLLMSQHWAGRLKQLKSDVGRHRIKFDLMIVAIARVAGAREILSDDKSVKDVAAITGMPARGIADLPLPPEPDQSSFQGL